MTRKASKHYALALILALLSIVWLLAGNATMGFTLAGAFLLQIAAIASRNEQEK